MGPGFQKFVVEKNLPLLMQEFPVTVSHKSSTRSFLPSSLKRCELFESVGELKRTYVSPLLNVWLTRL